MVGILKHPWFDPKNQNLIFPMFDYLIIDEVSKTTFQKFLIPALYAKRWILVGDIKQLAPYAESVYLERYFEKLTDANRSLVVPQNLQKALFYLFILRHVYFETKTKNNVYQYLSRMSFWAPLEPEVFNFLGREVRERIKKSEKDLPITVFIDDSDKKALSDDEVNFFVITHDKLNEDPTTLMLLTSARVIFVKPSLVNEVVDYIPMNAMILNIEGWESHCQYFRWSYYIDTIFKEKDQWKRKKVQWYLRRQNDYFKEKKSWASELSWRLIRLHELRNVKESGSYKRYLDEIAFLLPKTVEVRKFILNAYSVALPSILESLQMGIQDSVRGNVETVLKRGFSKKVFQERHKMLKKQFRMHPEISKFPAKVFYELKALKDSDKVKKEREWDYRRYGSRPYKSRLVWINKYGRQESGNKNPSEAKKLMSELKAFVNWARGNPKKEGEPWTVICLTYYLGQERILRKMLRDYTGQVNRTRYFEKYNVKIMLSSVDKVQGKEADVVLLSMVRVRKKRPSSDGHRGGNIGFMDNPNRLNVALTRPKFQLIIIGDLVNFEDQDESPYLEKLTKHVAIEGNRVPLRSHGSEKANSNVAASELKDILSDRKRSVSWHQRKRDGNFRKRKNRDYRKKNISEVTIQEIDKMLEKSIARENECF